MSSVEVDPTLSMAVEQAAVAAASAIVSAGGLDGAVSGATACDPSTVTDGVDIAFVTRFGGRPAAVVFSEALAAALASSDGAEAEPDAAWETLTSLTDMGANAVVDRLSSLVEGLGSVASAEPLAEGLGELRSGEARRVDVTVGGQPAGWLMWIASPELLDGLSARGGPAVAIDAIDYPDLGEGAPAAEHGADISFLSDVTMGVTVELGRTVMRVREVLQLTQGSVVELDRAAGALVDVLISGSVVARGEVVVMDDQLGVRVVEIVDSQSASR